ncbi:MAG: PQQ-binding-like beta-propeller repeat protein [Planctomycetes bacterium]|nr:PQQ-binding-like beta-propeller repeat protein [Planctomycetota bacterium]
MSMHRIDDLTNFARTSLVQRRWPWAISVFCAALGILLDASPAWAQPTSEVFQLTTGSVFDLSPAVDGTTYVWRRGSGGFGEIYMWTEGDAEPAVISTDNEEFGPRISDGRVVWESLSGSGSDYDVYVWENGSAAPLFNNSDDERVPDVGGFGMVWRFKTWWLVYDNGQEQIEITAGVDGIDEYPRVEDSFLVWEASTNGNSNGTEIFYWDNGNLVQLTNNNYGDRRPETDGATVVWFAANGPSGSNEIMRWTPGEGTTQLTNNAVSDTQPDVSGDVVVFARDDGNDFEIFFRYLGVDYQITDNDFNDFEPAIDGDRVVWNGLTSGGVRHIYYAILSGLEGGSPPGACCTGMECSSLTESECDEIAGQFIGPETFCGVDSCPEAVQPAGGWWTYQHDAQRTGRTDAVMYPQSTRIWRLHTGELDSPSPAIGPDGTIYVEANSTLAAVQPDGSLLWSSPYTPRNTPAIRSDGHLFVPAVNSLSKINHTDGSSFCGSGNTTDFAAVIDLAGNCIYCISDFCRQIGPDCSEQWTTAGFSVASHPVLDHDGGIYVAGPFGIVKIDPLSGDELWSFATSGPTGDPAIGADNSIYCTVEPNMVLALNLDGSEQWTTELADYGVDGSASPAIAADGTLYVVGDVPLSDDHLLIALSPAGDELWRFTEPNSGDPQAPVIDGNGTILFSMRDHQHLVALAPADGSELWRAGVGGDPLIDTNDYGSGPIDIPVETDAQHIIMIEDEGIVLDLNVQIRVLHERIGDLRIMLTHLGTTVTILDQVCGDYSDFACTMLDDEAEWIIEEHCESGFCATYQPSNPLSAFDGMPLTGAWILTIEDLEPGNTGTLEEWFLRIEADLGLDDSARSAPAIGEDGTIYVTTAGGFLVALGCFPNDDCNNNGIPDCEEIQSGKALDCNHNSLPDECDIAKGGSSDKNANGVPDECENPAGFVGACCAAPECQILVEQDCIAAGGVFMGEDTVCSPEQCFPEVTVQPVSQIKCVGEEAIFAIEATGAEPLSYQWLHDWLSIPGADSAVLSIASVGLGDAGLYTCVVSNDFGPAQSDPAFLTVVEDSGCSDGLFCNGAEVCITEGICGPGSDPCVEPGFPMCNEQDDVCEPACQGDEDCDDGDPCNGLEVCNPDIGQCETDNSVTCFGDNDAFTTSEDKLWGVDLTDGSEWLIGTAFSTQWLAGLTFNSSNGQLYAVETDEIVILDTTDGHVLWSGAHGLSLSSTPSGLAFDREGNLYLVHDGITYTVDILTGLATELGSNSLDNSGSLAFSPDGQLYAIGAHPELAGFSGLARLDPDTGALVEVIGPLTDPMEPGGFLGGMGMDFNSRGVLYMSNSIRDKLYTVSLEDAVVTEIGTLPLTFGSLAIFRDCNGNSVHDAHDVLTGESPDVNNDGIPDECSFCGDGSCDSIEDDCSCPADCGAAPASEEPNSTCNDGEDNDCDLLTDCEDPDCEADPACAPPPTPGGPGDVLFTTGANQRVVRVDGITGQFLHDIPSQPVMSNPVGLTIGNDGLLYVAGSSTRNIVRYDLVTGLLVDTFVESESGGLNGPWDITFGPDTHLYVVDRGVSAVRRYDGETGAYIDEFVTAGSGGLFDATGLVFHPSGDLLVASGFGQNILRFDGSNGDYVGDFVPPQEGGLVQPYGLIYGPDGNLYVSSKNSQGEVYRFDGSTGAFMDVFIAKGSGDLSDPIGLAFGPDGHLYVSSTTGNVVMRYDGGTGEFLGGFAYGPLLSTPRYLIFQPPECLEDSDCDDGDANTEDVCFTYECHHPPFSRLFVDKDAQAGNNGESWGDAYTDLQDALDAAASAAGAIEIWVAEGTYTPDRATGDRTASFHLRDAKFLYGGFEGTETALEERNPAIHPTILSGDLEANDDPQAGPGSGSNCCVSHEGLGCDDAQCEQVVCEINPECCTDFWNVGCGVVAEQNCCQLCATDNVTLCDNSHHVVVASDSGRDAPALMDGFIVTGGNANGPDFKAPQDRGGGLLMFVGSPTISNCTFIANTGTLGGGAHCEDSSRPAFTNVAFLGNSAETAGGGLGLHSNTNAVLTNCIFSGNTAEFGGGLAAFNGSRPTLTNCTLSANMATDSGGGIYNFGSTWTISNSILWDNSDSGGSDESAQLDGNANWFIDYCCIEGWTGDLGGEGNTGDCDPLLQNPAGEDGIPGTADDDLHLAAGSPAIDFGNNSADTNANLAGIQPLPESDLDNHPRIRNGTVDRGAYEFVGPCPADLSQDSSVNAFDLALLLGSWGLCPGCAADIDGNGVVNAFDLAQLLGSWGPC